MLSGIQCRRRKCARLCPSPVSSLSEAAEGLCPRMTLRTQSSSPRPRLHQPTACSQQRGGTAEAAAGPLWGDGGADYISHCSWGFSRQQAEREREGAACCTVWESAQLPAPTHPTSTLRPICTHLPTPPHSGDSCSW